MNREFGGSAWKGFARAFLRDRRGATAIEYGLIVSLIFIAILGAVAGTGSGVSGGWQAMGTKVAEALQ